MNNRGIVVNFVCMPFFRGKKFVHVQDKTYTCIIIGERERANLARFFYNIYLFISVHGRCSRISGVCGHTTYMQYIIYIMKRNVKYKGQQLFCHDIIVAFYGS